MPTTILRIPALICGSVIVLLCQWMIVKGQDERHPQRGFNPGTSYSLSQLETIGMSSGNLMLQVPLGSLPPGRGGTPGFTLGLTYNSKLYDSHVDQVPNDLGVVENRNDLNDSEDGGWRYTLPDFYSMRVVSRLHDEPGPPCADGVSPNEYQKNSFLWKVKMIYPDGSSHEFRPAGFTDQFYDGFFNVSPNGWQFWDSLISDPPSASCSHSETLATTGPMVYYSTDASYVRLVVGHDSNPADHLGADNQWTLYFPDGRRITNDPNQPQRTYDRNNHYVDTQYILYNNHPAYKVIDELGRYIIVERDMHYDPYTGNTTEQDYVYVKGTGGEEMRWTVHWKEIYVYKQYKATIQAGALERGNTYLTPLEMVFRVVDQITLPTQAGGLTYSFGYNAGDCIGDCGSQQILSNGWGELSSVTLPSGARATYTYALDGVSAGESSTRPSTNSVLNNKPTGKQQIHRPENDLSTAVSNTPCDPLVEACITENWQYSPGAMPSTTKPFITSITGPDGGTHTEAFVDDPNSPYNGRTVSSVQPDGTKIENLWQENRAPGMNGISVNPFIKTVFTSIKDAAGNYVKTAIKDYDFDKNGNVTRVAEYDWVAYSSVQRQPVTDQPVGIPAGLSPQRVSVTVFYAGTPDALNTTTDDTDIYDHVSAPQLLNAASSIEVSNSSSQPLARAELFYDNPTTTGNLTERRTWDSHKGAYSNPLSSANSISIINQFDPQVLGKLVQVMDARGFTTEYTYGAINGFADLYPTETRVAAGTTVQRRTTAEYDFYTGLVTRATDADNNVSTAMTYDVFGRPILVKVAEGKPEEARTATEYSDTLRRVIIRSDLNVVGDGKLVGIQHYDQLGRVRLARQLENSTTQSATDETQGIKVQTRYLISGSNSFVLTSNPYRAAYSSGAGSESTMGWTRSMSDNGGRLVEIQTFGSAGLPAPWGSNTTSTGTVTTAYNSTFTTVTDQAGRSRRSMTDGLGYLVRVDEPDKDSGNLDDGNGNPVQSTSYTYDVVGNLLTVTQGTQTPRSFSYDSLSRLRSAANPESGTVGYQYDDNGNLLVKTDGRGISAHYDYDELNRVKRRWYNGSSSIANSIQNIPPPPSGVGATDEVNYVYDSGCTGCYTKGKLISVSSSVSAYTYSGYDAMGRAGSGTQTVGSQSYTSTYAHDLSGHVKTMTYPSGHVVNYNYDNAGRLADKDATHLAFTGNFGGGPSRNYSTGILYDAASRMTQEQFGTTTAIFNKLSYNSRGQLAEIRAGTASVDDNRGRIVNDYSGTDNNGNLRKQTVYVPNDDQNASPTSWYQQYEYDSLNRLTQVHEHASNTNLLWQQQFFYDRYGNRTTDYNNTSSNIPRPQFTVSTTNNRLGVPSGQTGTMTYDSAGNLTTDTYSAAAVTRVYDAENRMTSETQANSYVAGSYSYDGDGRRVKRVVGGVETWQVYGLGGELLAEYAANASYTNPQKEYGYRNGQLLITATVTSGWGAAPTLHDNPLVVNETTVQARHITELRDAINALRSHLNMSPYSWQYSVTTNDWITANPILEMRTVLDQALGAPSGGYSAGLAQYESVKAIHIQELRDRVLAAWTNGSSAQINWLVSDQLGTPRMILDQTGSLASVSRHDYLPFGEDLGAGVGLRSAGYTGDATRQKFTQKERDNETGLDYFGARYYASMQGRFTSVDPSRKSITTVNPQTWNRYTYALNNPLAYVDQNGKWPTWIHNLIIDNALHGLSGAERQKIKDGSWSVDDPSLGGQNSSHANEHGMTMPGQSQDDAAEKADQFIETKVDEAKAFKAEGNDMMSLCFFGKAFHTVSDMTSPAHEGYQVWYWSQTSLHMDTEKAISSFRMGLAVGATIALYKYTYGQEALKRAVDYTPGSQNDPSVLAIQREFSLPGSNPMAESEALYEYRLGLQEGLNFDWARQRGRRGRRQSERPMAN